MDLIADIGATHSRCALLDHEGAILAPETFNNSDFEGVEVAGELVKPQGALLLDRKRASFNPLIKLRTDFNQEMSESVNEVK